MSTTAMCDLSWDLVEEILSRVPITSLRAVRSTCKRWNDLSKDPRFTKKHCSKEAKEILVIMICDLRARLMSVNLHNYKDLADPPVKQIGKLNDQVEISKVFHCDGLLLCVIENNSRLMVLNPYLGQTKWIQNIQSPHNILAIGYDSDENHKILRYQYSKGHVEYDIYDFKSSSWRGLGLATNHNICEGVNLKGDSYFIAQEQIWCQVEEYLICFDFTSERFGPLLHFPFRSHPKDYVVLSVVREEKLAVLFHKYDAYEIGIWITTKIEANAVSWSNFLKVDMNDRSPFPGSFFIEEKNKVAMICDIGSKMWSKDKAYMVGENGYYRDLDLKESKCWKLMCSYVPSSVQIQQGSSSCRRQKRKKRDH